MKKFILPVFALTFTIGCGNSEQANSSNNNGEETNNPTASSEKVLLRLTPEKDDNFNCTMDMDMNIDGPMSMKMVMGMNYGMKVTNVAENGDVTFENVFTKVSMDMNNPMMGEMSYNSDNVDGEFAQQMHQTMGGMLNKPVEMIMDNKAGIIKAPDLSELIDDPNQSGQFDQTTQQMFVLLPEKEVTVGDSWDKEIKTDNQGTKMIMAMKYTVKEITESEVILDLEGEITSDEGSISEVEGDITGSLILDKANGMTKKAEMLQDFDMTVMGQQMAAKNKIILTATK